MTKHPRALLSTLPLACALLGACATQSPETSETADASPFLVERKVVGETNDSSQRAGTLYPSDSARYFTRLDEARELVRNGDCANAAPLLEESVQEYTDDGNVWGLLGKCRGELKDWDNAVAAYEMALKLGVRPWDLDLDLNPNDIMVKIAGLYAQAGDSQRAMSWLHRGLEMRYDERPGLLEAPEFASLRDNEDFAALVGLPKKETLSRDEQWRYDIEFMRKHVAMLHFDPDHYTSAEQLDEMLSSLAGDVPNLSDERITARLVVFVGALGAGHDTFSPVGGTRGTLLPFALKVFMFTDGLYIIDAYDPSLIGSRIDSIDARSIEEMYPVIAKAFPGDNDMEVRWQAARHFMQPSTLEALGLVRDATNVKVTITDPTGQQRTIVPGRRAFTPSSPALTTPPSSVTTPLYLSRMKERHWMQRIDELDALYVQVNAIAPSDSETLQAFAERMGREAADKQVRNLILDLRHSPGGNGYLTPSLLRQLVHFDASPEKDELYVIISRNTFSASHNLIVDLDWVADPVFVGEPSGSRPNAISESGRIRLPYSQFLMSISSQFHQHSFPEDHRWWIAPDVPASLSSEDFFSGRDPALEAIKNLIAKPRPH